MAAPASMTTKDITGRFYLNKTLSDPTDKFFALQGMSWATRTVIAIANLTLDVNHFTDEKGVEHINIRQTLSGGIKGTTENRALDWTERHNEDHIFGAVISKTRRAKLEEISEEFLKTDWLPEVNEDGVIHSYVITDKEKNKNDWIVDQTWGFEQIEGEKRYARHLKLIANGGKDTLEVKLIYDYLGA